MEFFGPVPPEPPPERHPRPVIPPWVQAPQDEVPVAVPMIRRLARVPGAVLLLRRLDVYREGVSFRLRLDIRIDGDLPAERREKFAELLDPHARRFGGEGMLRLGVTLSDGTRAETRADGRVHGWSMPLEPPEPPQLVMFGGGGNSDADRLTAEARAWLWPLPPPGPLTLHFVSDAAGIPEGSCELDATPLIDAARDATPVWPD